MGIHMRSISSNTIHRVRMARLSVEVKATSKEYPSSLRILPAE